MVCKKSNSPAPKEKYKADHAVELKQFYEARRKLSAEFPDGKIDRQKLDAEYARLEQEHEETYAQFKSIREDSQQLWKIESHIDSVRKDVKQTQNRNHQQEQEIRFLHSVIQKKGRIL